MAAQACRKPPPVHGAASAAARVSRPMHRRRHHPQYKRRGRSPGRKVQGLRPVRKIVPQRNHPSPDMRRPYYRKMLQPGYRHYCAGCLRHKLYRLQSLRADLYGSRHPCAKWLCRNQHRILLKLRHVRSQMPARRNRRPQGDYKQKIIVEFFAGMCYDGKRAAHRKNI